MHLFYLFSAILSFLALYFLSFNILSLQLFGYPLSILYGGEDFFPFFNVGIPKEDIFFLDTFYVLYFIIILHITFTSFSSVWVLIRFSCLLLTRLLPLLLSANIWGMYYKRLSRLPGVLQFELQQSLSTSERLIHHTQMGFDPPCAQSQEFTEWKTQQINAPSHHGGEDFVWVFYTLFAISPFT